MILSLDGLDGLDSHASAAPAATLDVSRILARFRRAGVRARVRSDAALFRAAGSRGATWLMYPGARDQFDPARPFLVVFNPRARYPWAHFSATAFAAVERDPALVHHLVRALLVVRDACTASAVVVSTADAA